MGSSAWTPVDETAAKWTPVEEKATPTNGAKFTAPLKPWTVPWLKEKLYNIADSLTESLPGAGATAGAIIGGGAGTGVAPGAGTAVGAVGGAGIGGMAGEALKQHVRRALDFGDVPQTSEEAANAISKAGLVQGGIQAATEVLPMAAGPLRNASVRQYTQALKPTTAENKVIAQDIVPQMIDRGIHGSTEDMEQQAAQKITELRPGLKQVYSQVPQGATATQSPITSTLKALEDMKGRYVVDGEVANPQAVNAINGVQDIIEKHGNGISPQSLRKIKQIFDESVSEAGGYTNNDLTTNYSLKAQKEAANQIRSVLHNASPDAAAADKEISFWLDVQQVAKASNLRRAGQEGGLLKTLTPMATGAAGAVAGISHGAEASLGAAAASAMSGYVAQAMRTPAWRATSAIMKDRLADALTRGDVRTVSAVLGRLGVAIPAAVTSQQQLNRSAQPQE